MKPRYLSPICRSAPRRSLRAICLSSVMLVSLGGISSVQGAADGTWNGTTDGTWDVGTNWSGGDFPAGTQTATFDNAGNSNTAINIATATQPTKFITFDTAASAAYTFGGGRFRVRQDGIIQMTSSVVTDQTFNNTVSLGIDDDPDDFSFLNQSTSAKLIFNGLIEGDTAGTATVGTKNLIIGGAGDIDVNGVIENTAQGIGSKRKVGLTKVGAGTLTLSNAANIYTGYTRVTEGALVLSPTGTLGLSLEVVVSAGALLSLDATNGHIVASGAMLGGAGSVTGGPVVVESGGAVVTDDGAIGTFTVDSLELQSGWTGEFEIPAAGGTSDLVDVTTLDGMTMDDGSISLFEEGTENPFSLPGTYTLFQYSGTLGGTPAITVSNPAPATNYDFTFEGGIVQVAVSTSASFWDVDADGSWNTVSNWTSAAAPDGQNLVAAFGGGTAITTARIVTVDGDKILGKLIFDSVESFTLNPGNPGTSAITFDNTFGNARLDVLSGSHTVAAALVTPADFDLQVLSGADVTISGAISGAGSIILDDGGSATLSGSNSYTGGITVNDGALTLEGDQTGVAGDITVGLSDVPGRVLTIAAGATASVDAANGIQLGANNTSVSEANIAGMTVDGNMANDGTLTFGRPGSLTLNSGASWIQTGAMAMRAWGNIGGPEMTISAGSTFTYAGASTIKLNGPQVGASQTGISTLTISGLFETNFGFEEDLTITPGSGFAQVVIDGGEIRLTDNVASLATSANNKLRFELQNTATVDTNGFDATMSLPITGNGGLTKSGAGTLVMTAVNTYTGATVITGGILSVNGTSIDDSGSLDIAGGILSVTANETVATLTYDGGAPLADGTYGSTASTATFKDNTRFDVASSGVLTVGASASSYQTWADANVGGDGPELDFDNDGTQNGIEYFMNSPAGFTANPGIVSESITWMNGENIAPDQYGIQYVVQTSGDLVNWSNVDEVDLATNDATTLTYDVPAGTGPLFVRLSVIPN